MTRCNPDEPTEQILAFELLHNLRAFSPTQRQRDLYQELLGQPRPTPTDNQAPDRQTLPGGS